MRIAIPVIRDELSPHFGHCERFAFFDVDEGSGKIVARETESAPVHQPGLLPGWLAEKEAEVVIAGGMGSRARDLCSSHNIDVVIGVSRQSAEKLVQSYLAGTLGTGKNVCDH